MADDLTSDLHGLRRRKMLAAVGIIGGVSQVTAFSILAVLHLLPYYPAAFGILLGLHLPQLAGVFHAPAFRTIGWSMALWCTGCLLLTSHLILMSTAGVVILAAFLATNLFFRQRTPA